MTSDVRMVHRLPGRFRLAVPGLCGNPVLAARLNAGLLELSEVRSVRANACSGRVLIECDPDTQMSEALAVRLNELRAVVPEKPGAEVGNLAWRTLTPSTMLVALCVKRLWAGPSLFSGFYSLFLLSSLLTILSGYLPSLPLFGKRRHLAAGLGDIASVAGTGVYALREDLVGLASSAAIATTRFESAVVRSLHERGVSPPPALPAAQQRLDAYQRRITSTAFSTAALSWLISRHHAPGLGVLLAANPVAARTGVLAAHNAAWRGSEERVAQALHLEEQSLAWAERFAQIGMLVALLRWVDPQTISILRKVWTLVLVARAERIGAGMPGSDGVILPALDRAGRRGDREVSVTSESYETELERE